MPKGETSEVATGVTLRGAAAEQRLFGRYTLKRVLGRGGMGIVWLAHDDELKRSVAMKFLPDMIVRDREAVEDLKRETRRSLDLTHHHIVRIYDFTQDENSAAIIMEYVDGETLSAMKTQQPGACFNVSTLAIWAGHFCQALDYAHRQARVVHRDLKPANLMVNSRGDLKITDFGISRSMSDSMTRVSMSNTAGTLAYMSPEQALGAPPAASDDVYAFGATTYDLLTGRPPFFRGNLQVQLETVVPPPMHARRAELGNSGEPIPALWEEVIAACLAKRPQDRPQSMAEIANLLGIGGPTTGYRPATNPNFTPITGVVVPATTPATERAQPPTTPTLQRTLSPEELVTMPDRGPNQSGALGSPARPGPSTGQVRPTSLGDVIPGFDYAETRAKASPPAPAPDQQPTAPESEPPAEQNNGIIDESFPTLVELPATSSPADPAAEQPALPEEPPAIAEEARPIAEGPPVVSEPAPDVSDNQPVVAEEKSIEAGELPIAAAAAVAAAADSDVPASSPEPASAIPDDDSFPTLRGTPLETAAEQESLADTQQPLQEQETPIAQESSQGATLTDSGIGINEQLEPEFPTFAGTPLPEAEAPPSVSPEPAAEAVPSEEQSKVAAPAAPDSSAKPEFAPHAFVPASSPAVAPPQLPTAYPGTPRRSRAQLFIVLASLLVAVGGAIWLATRPPKPLPAPTPKELAQPFVEEGRRLFAADALDSANEQAGLALEKNPGDSDAIQLQQEIEARRKAIADAAEQARIAAENRVRAQREIDEKRVREEQDALNRAAAAKLISEGELLYPEDLPGARLKADQALQKVPDEPKAKALITKINARQQEEINFASALKDAKAALARNDLAAAQSAIDDIPPDFSSRPELRAMRNDLAAARSAAQSGQSGGNSSGGKGGGNKGRGNTSAANSQGGNKGGANKGGGSGNKGGANTGGGNVSSGNKGGGNTGGGNLSSGNKSAGSTGGGSLSSGNKGGGNTGGGGNKGGGDKGGGDKEKSSATQVNKGTAPGG